MAEIGGGSKVQMERIVAIVDKVKTGAFPNCNSLATDLEVSAKTIQRDISFIRDRLGYPIEYDQIKHGYSFTDKIGDISHFDVKVEDLAALFIARHTMRSLRGSQLANAMQPAFVKIAKMLDGKISLTHTDIDQVFTSPDVGVVQADLELFGKITEAILVKKKINFSYQKMGDSSTMRRSVHPYKAQELNGGWYLVGYDEDRDARRTFAMQRMQDFEMTDQQFERDEGMLLEGELRIKIALEVRGWVARVVQERKWHATQTIESIIEDTGIEDGEVVQLSMVVSHEEEMLNIILSWGRYVKILYPHSLLERVRAEMKLMSHWEA